MTDDIFVTLGEMHVGVARFGCPHCFEPLVIRFEETATASPALRLFFHDLTIMQRRTFDAVQAAYPHAIETSVVSDALGQTVKTLRMMVRRMRPKLTDHGWQLVLTHGTLRLIGPTSTAGSGPGS